MDILLPVISGVSSVSEEILRLIKLKKYFINKDGIVKAVDGVNISLNKGETLGIVGESGSGKSTIAYTVMGMYEPTEGQLLFKGKDIGYKQSRRSKSLKSDIQIVFQDPGTSLNPRHSIKQILEMPLRVHNIVSPHERIKRILELLEIVELPKSFINKYPLEIGEGEKQSVAIARALAVKPSLIVLDEPTSALDVSMQAKIINLLMELQQEFHFSYLFITHDLSLMRNVATRVAIMYLGRIYEVALAEEFFQNPLHPYTRMLISSVPVVSEIEEKMKPERYESRGEIPSPVNIPKGCGFNPRCIERQDICTRKAPEMLEVKPDHFVWCHKYDKG
jgi:peptide/nickel transport system ATP-binding protein